MTEKKDTSPFIRARRIVRRVQIQEKSIPSTPLLDITDDYLSTDLPEWFAPLQPIVEDETFTSMVINLGGRVHYHITRVGEDDKIRDEIAYQLRIQRGTDEQ